MDRPAETTTDHGLLVVPFLHPQGCRSYLVADPESRQALALDVHLDTVAETAARVTREGWDLRWVIDSHTHADHPSGAKRLSDWFSATRVAHPRAGHAGTTLHPQDGEAVEVGRLPVRFLHAPGHTPDHMVVVAQGNLFAGDTLLIGGVARTDFLGGDAGELYDSLNRILAALPAETTLFPGHDYQGRVSSTLARERTENAWLQIRDRAEFVRRLTANKPPRPANMDDLLRWNREGTEIPPRVPAALAAQRARSGGAGRVIDVRTDAEVRAEWVPGSRHVVLDEVQARADEIRAAPAPRLILCRTGNRATKAQQALDALGVQGLSVIEGGIEAYRSAGGPVATPRKRRPLEAQSRIALGAAVVLGAALALLVSPWASVLCAVAGLWLVGSALAGKDPLASLLGRLPWNRDPLPTQSPKSAPAAGGTCAASACSAGPPGR
jgi:glyoxylase-like metal-dependent hydrolase (beta-lactamase superfamily II)